MKFTVHTSYQGYSSERDAIAHNAAGRLSDFGGAGFGEVGPGYRDLGWRCDSETDAHRIRRNLERVGFKVTVRNETP